MQAAPFENRPIDASPPFLPLVTLVYKIVGFMSIRPHHFPGGQKIGFGLEVVTE